MRPLLPLLLMSAFLPGFCRAEEARAISSPSPVAEERWKKEWRSSGSSGRATNLKVTPFAADADLRPLQELIKADPPSSFRPLGELQTHRLARVRLYNPNPYPVVFYARGGGEDVPRVSEAWTSLKDSQWEEGAFDFCGTGLRIREIAPEGRMEVDVVLPGHAPQQALLTFYRKDDRLYRSRCVIFEQR